MQMTYLNDSLRWFNVLPTTTTTTTTTTDEWVPPGPAGLLSSLAEEGSLPDIRALEPWEWGGGLVLRPSESRKDRN